MLRVIRVSRPRQRPFSGFLFVHFGEIIHMHPRPKFQVCSCTRFGNMFESVPNIISVASFTWSRPRPFRGFLFVHFGKIVHMHPYSKFEVCSFTRFRDTFEGVPNFIRVTWPKPRPFYDILFIHFREIVHMPQRAKFQVCSFARFGDMFQGVPNFIRITWPRPHPSERKFVFVLFWFADIEQCAKYRVLAIV